MTDPPYVSHVKLFDNAHSAMLSAIELFNKPRIDYPMHTSTRRGSNTNCGFDCTHCDRIHPTDPEPMAVASEDRAGAWVYANAVTPLG